MQVSPGSPRKCVVPAPPGDTSSHQRNQEPGRLVTGGRAERGQYRDNQCRAWSHSAVRQRHLADSGVTTQDPGTGRCEGSSKLWAPVPD